MARKTIDELRLTTEYQSLTPGQQRYVQNYISNGHDVTKAYFDAYECKDMHVALCASYAVMRRPSVQMVLSLYFHDSPDEAFIDFLWKQIQKGKITKEQFHAWQLYADVRRLRYGVTQNAMEMAAKLGVKQYGPRRLKPPVVPLPDAPISPPDDFLKDFE